jgi:Protein of unknown function (DUF732)
MFTLRHLTTFVGTAAAGTAFGLAALVTAGTAGATVITPIDDTFISVISDAGIEPPSVEEAIAVANDVCLNLDSGATLVDSVYAVADYTGLATEDAAYFAGASIASYCPEYLELVEA